MCACTATLSAFRVIGLFCHYNGALLALRRGAVVLGDTGRCRDGLRNSQLVRGATGREAQMEVG